MKFMLVQIPDEGVGQTDAVITTVDPVDLVRRLWAAVELGDEGDPTEYMPLKDEVLAFLDDVTGD